MDNAGARGCFTLLMAAFNLLNGVDSTNIVIGDDMGVVSGSNLARDCSFVDPEWYESPWVGPPVVAQVAPYQVKNPFTFSNSFYPNVRYY